MWTAFVLMLARFQDSSELAPREPRHHVVALEIAPDAQVLDGHGPSAAWTFVPDFTGALYVWPAAPDIDLCLRVDRESRTISRDDDSAGASRPCVTVAVQQGRPLVVHVALQTAAAPTDARGVELHLVEAPETAETSAATRSWPAAKARILDAAKRGDPDGARALLTSELARIVASEGAETSAGVVSTVLDLVAVAYELEVSSVKESAFAFLVRHFERALPQDHPTLLATRGNHALALLSLGAVARARELLEEVLAGFERSLPPEHPDVLMAAMNLALPLQALGEQRAARELLERAVDGFGRTRPPDDPDFLRAQENLANTLYALGEYEGSRELLEHAREGYSRTRGPDHPSVLATSLNLATTLVALGELFDARAIHEQVIESYERWLAPDQPRILAARMNLAVILRQGGDLPGSRALLERVLETYERILPDDNSVVLRTRLNLAITLQAMGDFLGARVLLERLLAVYERTKPEDDADLLITKMNLATALLCLDDGEAARHLLEQVVEVRERTLPSDHGDLSMTRVNLAIVLLRERQVARALALLEGVVQVYDRTLAPDHPTRLAARFHLALALAAAGDRMAAREIQEDVVARLERVRPSDHRALLSARESLATILLQTGDHASALALIPAQLAGMTSRVLSTFALAPSEARGIAATDAPLVANLLFLSQDAAGADRARVFELIETQRIVAEETPRARYLVDVDPTLLQLSTRTAQARAELNDLVSDAGERDVRAEFERNLRERDAAERAIHAELARRGLFAEAVASSALAAVLPPDGAAVGYLRYQRFAIDAGTHATASLGDHLLAHVLKPDGSLQRVELGPAAALEDLVAEWRGIL